jgi:aquaporin rerated protein, other eukaryote
MSAPAAMDPGANPPATPIMALPTGSSGETTIAPFDGEMVSPTKSHAASRPRSVNPQPAFRRYSSDEPVSASSLKPQRPVRYRDDWDEDLYRDYRDFREFRDSYRDFDRGWKEEIKHPDYYDRRGPKSRPPRAYLNRPNPEEREDTMGKVSFDETSSIRDPFDARNRRIADEEMGYDSSERANNGTMANRIDWHNMTREERVQVMRLPWTEWMNSSFKNHFVASLGEFVGTTMFLLFAFGGTEVANIQSAANNSDSSSDSNTTTGGSTGFNVGVLLYISVIFGFSLMVNVWIFFRISGGLFNPAVTLAMTLVKAIPPARAACLFVAQMCGGLMASVIVRFLFPENFNVRTTLGGGASVTQGVFIEAILTAELVFTIFMLAKEKHRATFIAPVGIGLALFIAELVGVQFTGGSLNPARSFGPCVVTATFDQEHWIYCKSLPA